MANNPDWRAESRQRVRHPSSISLGHLLALFLKVGSLGFGGGMAVIALMEGEFVQKRKLLSAEEFLHGVGLGQLLGSFAVNAAYFIGYRLFGAAGGLLSSAAFLMPSLVLVTALSDFYFRYHAIPRKPRSTGRSRGDRAHPNAAFGLGRKVLHALASVSGRGAAGGSLKVNAVWILLAAGIAGLLLPGDSRPDSIPDPARPPRSHCVPVTIGRSLLSSTAVIFLKIGMVFFGGGFVLVPLHHRLVTQLG